MTFFEEKRLRARRAPCSHQSAGTTGHTEVRTGPLRFDQPSLALVLVNERDVWRYRLAIQVKTDRALFVGTVGFHSRVLQSV